MTREWLVQLWSNIQALLRPSVRSDSENAHTPERETEEALRVAQGFMARYRNALRELGR